MDSDATAGSVVLATRSSEDNPDRKIDFGESHRRFPEARREQRTPCDAIPARVQLGAASESLMARVMDVSVSGVRLRLESPLEVGSEVTVWFERVVVTGQVRYCRRVGDGPFESGLCLSEVLNIA
jgi:PilZ domain